LKFPDNNLIKQEELKIYYDYLKRTKQVTSLSSASSLRCPLASYGWLNLHLGVVLPLRGTASLLPHQDLVIEAWKKQKSTREFVLQ
jgi:hypothetical protein